jgi:hypothetical protein
MAIGEQAASNHLDFAGGWQLNQELSDSVPLLPGEAMAQARASGAIRTPADLRRASGGPDVQRVVFVRNRVRDALHAAAQLTVRRRGRTIAMTDSSGRTLNLELDGKPRPIEDDNLRFTLVARWDSPALVVERKFEDGMLVADSYLTFNDPRQLVVTTTISHSRMQEKPVVVRRVYDPMPER